MLIRPIEEKDQARVFDLLDQLIKAAKANDGQPYAKPDFTEREGTLRKFLGQGGRAFVAEEEGRIVGLVTVFILPVARRGEDRALVEDLVVDEAWRGRGVGKALLDRVKDLCRSQGIKVLKLNTQIANDRAHSFYEREGGAWAEKCYRFDIRP